MLLTVLIYLALLLGVIAVYALGAVYAERKVSAWIQHRTGPLETGPAGILQTLADILKLLTKESIVPAAADKPLFTLAPILVFGSIFAGFAVIPFGVMMEASGLSVGLLFLLAVVSIEVVALLMAGWGSNNKYALLGAFRSVSQILSYEIPATLALLAAVLMYGSLNLTEISLNQGIYATQPVYFLGFADVTQTGGFLSWAMFRYPHLLVAFVVFFIASLAESNRAPFDLPEAESELVSGFHVEYSGFRFAAFMLAEYASMFLLGLLAAVMFMGAWNTPLPNLGPVRLADWTSGGAPGTVGFALCGLFWILAKALFLVFVQMWIRWTLPRVRVDQLVKLGWKRLTPIGFLLIAVSAVWKLLEVYGNL